MKKFIVSLAMAAVVALGVIGCATTPGNPQPPEITQDKLDKSAILLKGSVRSGLLLVIEKNGTNAQNYVCIAGQAINLLISSTNYTPGAIEKALSKLPSTDLKKTEVQLAISTILTAYEIYYADYVSGRVNGNQVAATLLGAVRDGVIGACEFSGGGEPVAEPVQ